MNKFKKSQVLVFSVLTILLIIAPLLSSSLRPTYIYFITNLLIIVLGAEAGLLKFFAKPSSSDTNDKKNTSSSSFVPQKPLDQSPNSVSEQDKKVVLENSDNSKRANGSVRVVEKCLSEKVVGSSKVEKVKKCPSMPSLFFIGGGDNEGDNNFGENYFEDYDDDDEQEVVGEISGQELFAKAENFIGNFYKQLKMQREESWKRIHGFYQRAF